MTSGPLVIEGEFGVYRVAELKPVLLALVEDTGDPAIDLGAVTEMDGAALQLLLFAEREARARGRQLRLAGASAAVAEALAVTGLGARFPVAEAV